MNGPGSALGLAGFGRGLEQSKLCLTRFQMSIIN